ncbi:MAG: DNA gyrase subunit A [Enterobacterales bacterium]
MTNINKNITKISIEDELKKSYLDYAMSVIVGRALPDARDGFKPVHRRILFAMYMLKNHWNKPYKKSARIVGDVIGKYHPHGDTAVYDAIVRMAQPFSLRYTLIDGQGNFGSIDGDSAAAMRYTEIRMTKISHEFLVDLEQDTIDYVKNYDGTDIIPNILPTKIPNLLINGSSGIAVGMATNIPPHNLTEVIDGCIAYINNNNISIENIMKYIKGPDLPTSGIIVDIDGIKNAYTTGKGKIYIYARSKIEKNKNGKKSIIIYELPYQVNKSKLIEKIVNLVKNKKIDGITNLRDESDQDGMRIVIETKKDAISNIILNNLYSMTQLKVSFNVNMVALYNNQPKLLNLKNILDIFLNHRKEIIIRRTIFNLKKSNEYIQNLEAISIAIININDILKLIKNSLNLHEAQNKLVAKAWSIIPICDLINIKIPSKINQPIFNNIKNGFYYLTNTQAKSILSLRLYKISSIEKQNIFYKYKQMIKKIKKLSSILENKKYLMNVIKNELIDIKKKYNDPRRTEIVIKPIKVNYKDLVNKKNVVITISHHGYIKNQPLIDYEIQHRGGKGKSATAIKNKDSICCILIANTHDTILLFSSKGKVYKIKVYKLPESSRGSRGKPIVNLLPLEQNERITTALLMKEYTKCSYVFMATLNGIVKKTNINELINIRNTGIIVISLHQGDELISVGLTNGSNEIMLFTSYGKVVRFPECQVKNVGRTALGVKGISLNKGDNVVSLIIPRKNIPILTITKYGYGKRTHLKEHLLKSRATQGVMSIKVTKRNGKVVGAIQASNYDQIVIITNVGSLMRINVSEINIVGRNTHGVILIKTSNKKQVMGLQRINSSIIFNK